MHQLFDLSGKVALVTGGSKGLGKAMARGLVEAGADVAISSRHEGELQAALKEILAGTERQGAVFVADLSQRSESVSTPHVTVPESRVTSVRKGMEARRYFQVHRSM